MNKTKKTLLVGGIVLMIIIAFVGGNVFAKYQSQITGQGTADVAKWAFEVNGNGSTIKTISLNNNYDESTLVGGKIAPGTSGSFDIVVDATGSEVGVEYKVEFLNETSKPTNLKFKFGDKEVNSLKELESALIGTIDANSETKEKTLTIDWVWEYETSTQEKNVVENDKMDTNEGIQDLNYTFDVVVTGTQVVPQK